MKTYYQLTFFDTKDNIRKKYLNGTSWENKQQAIDEFGRIMKESDRKQGYSIYSDRVKWALEAIIGKKRTLIQTLS